ncbi:MAG TPA: EamA family transporter [Firmicutes bacterium]|nr:EamA family transporter [Bacillota bacterium]
MGLRRAELQQTSRIPLWVTDLSLAGVAATWGLNHVIVKHTLANMHPLAFNAIRFGLASLTLLVILRLAEGGPARSSGRGAARSSGQGAAGGMWVRPVDTRPLIGVSLLGTPSISCASSWDSVSPPPARQP